MIQVRDILFLPLAERTLAAVAADKAFAASVNRDCIRQCSELGLELGDFLTLAIGAMAEIDEELGLRK